jgi:3-hydroxyisobutyrate dehydrogenase-like beta-hydroxyacid dehydrogenase
MTPPTVAVVAPGDMGHAVGRVLIDHGVRVVTVLAGRSRRTAELAAKAGIADLGDDRALLDQADMLLSILPPARAVELAERVAAALRAVARPLLYVDCNAIAPATVRRVARIVGDAGARFVDAGIIGAPPRPGVAGPRFYASGADAGRFAELAAYGLDVRVIGAEPGQASALKMCYAAMTKGVTAIQTQAFVAGRVLGVEAALRDEMQLSQAAMLKRAETAVPDMPPKAYRWVGEMEEIAATFGATGLTPRLFEGVAELYRFVEATPLGQETPERRSRGQTLDDVVAVLAEALRQRPRSTGG